MELTREIRDKRVAIARDMLAQLARQDIPLRMRSCHGYVRGNPDVPLGLDVDLRTCVDAVQARCDVCEKGALLLSKARLYNDVSLSVVLADDEDAEEVVDAEDDSINDALADIFDIGTLDRLEAAFECWDGLFPAEGEFGDQFDGAVERARAIAQNLIDNDGEFIVPLAVATQNTPVEVP